MAVINAIGQTKFRSNEELDQEENDLVVSARPAEDPTVGLAAHVREMFEAAKTAKLTVTTKQLATSRRVEGEYEADMLAALNEAGLPVENLPATYHKCRDAESWITEVLSSLGLDCTWSIEANGAIEIPPQQAEAMQQQVRTAMIQQAIAKSQQSGQPVDAESVITASKEMEEMIRKEVISRARSLAEERATNMEQLILSQLETGGWNTAFKAVVNDLTKFPCCVLKGPIYRKKKVLQYLDSGEAAVTEQIIPEFDRVNWFDWFPAANSINVDDGDGIELEHLQRKDFTKLIGVKGYNSEAIRKILRLYGGGFKENISSDPQRFALEHGNTVGYDDNRTNKIDSINYWGEVPGELLLEWGMSAADIPDPDIDYQVNVKLVNNIVYRAVLNPDLLGKKPFHVTSFIKNNDSQQGKSPADLMEVIQNGINQSVRFLIYNTAMSAGPITEIDIDRLADGQKAEVYPGIVLEAHGKQMTTPAVRVTQIETRAREFIGNITYWRQLADDLIVPSFSANEAGGADKTMGGRAMKIGAAARNIKLAIENVDNDVIIPAITMLFNNNMRFLDDPNIKGALKVKAKGVSKQILKDKLAANRNEFTSTLTQEEKQIMGRKGIAYNLRERAKSVELDPDRMVPGYQEIERGPSEVMQSTEAAQAGKYAEEAAKFTAEAAHLKSETILNIAKAEAAEVGQQLDQYIAVTDRLAVTQQPAPPEASAA